MLARVFRGISEAFKRHAELIQAVEASADYPICRGRRIARRLVVRRVATVLSLHKLTMKPPLDVFIDISCRATRCRVVYKLDRPPLVDKSGYSKWPRWSAASKLAGDPAR